MSPGRAAADHWFLARERERANQRAIFAIVLGVLGAMPLLWHLTMLEPCSPCSETEGATRVVGLVATSLLCLVAASVGLALAIGAARRAATIPPRIAVAVNATALTGLVALVASMYA